MYCIVVTILLVAHEVLCSILVFRDQIRIILSLELYYIKIYTIYVRNMSEIRSQKSSKLGSRELFSFDTPNHTPGEVWLKESEVCTYP